MKCRTNLSAKSVELHFRPEVSNCIFSTCEPDIAYATMQRASLTSGEGLGCLAGVEFGRQGAAALRRLEGFAGADCEIQKI